MNKLPVNKKSKVQSQKSNPRNEEHIMRTEIIVNAAHNLPFLAIVFCQGGEIIKTISIKIEYMNFFSYISEIILGNSLFTDVVIISYFSFA